MDTTTAGATLAGRSAPPEGHLRAIAWIRNRFMEMPFRRSVLQVVPGGALVLATGILIGGR